MLVFNPVSARHRVGWLVVVFSIIKRDWTVFAGQKDVRHGRAGTSVHRRRPSQVPQLHVQMLFHRAVDGTQTLLHGLRADRAKNVRRQMGEENVKRATSQRYIYH